MSVQLAAVAARPRTRSSAFDVGRIGADVPDVLPSFTASCSSVFSAATEFPGVDLPGSLTHATPKRKVTYLAGRFCAARAIAQLCGPAAAAVVTRGDAGEPLWPRGLTGSITHTGSFAWAAVARQGDAWSIGIDSERLLTIAAARQVCSAVLVPSECAVGDPAFGMALWVSLVFSAKEAIFKCLFPVVGSRFYYDAVALRRVDLPSRSFSAELLVSLSRQFRRGQSISGRFEFDSYHVHAAVCLPRSMAAGAE